MNQWMYAENAQDAITSEDDCLSIIDSLFPSVTAHTPYGRGDDCAELTFMPPHGPIALSTDFFWEQSHFRTSYFTPEEVGAKALTVAISDLAAAGVTPVGASLGLMFPPQLHRTSLEAVLAGMARAAEQYQITLTGGDISKGSTLGFCLTVWGTSQTESGQLLRRRQAIPGDIIFIIGTAGLARTGLLALEKYGRDALSLYPLACTAHLAPTARIHEGLMLHQLATEYAESSPRLAVMDLSDGIAQDMPRLLGLQGADLQLEPENIHPEIHAYAQLHNMSPESLYLAGGEDYALLGSCAEQFWPQLHHHMPDAIHIGRVTESPIVLCNNQPLDVLGFDHFRQHSTPDSPPSTTTCLQTQVDLWQTEADQSETQSIITVCHQAWQRGLLAGFNGNASCLLSASTTATPSTHCVITRSGAAKSQLTPSDLCIVDIATAAVEQGPRPSTEAAMHLAIYQHCPDAKAILHTHPPHLLALSLLVDEQDMLNIDLYEAAAYRAQLTFTPALPPGTQELAQTIAQKAISHAAVWMGHHGLVVRSTSLELALGLTEELEQLARIQLLACVKTA